MESEKIIEDAKEIIIDYCLSKCNAFCCRYGYLVLKDEKELEKVVGKKRNRLEKLGLLKKTERGVYSLYMGDPKYPCPSLNKENRCTIYPTRPNLCKEFPLFVYGNMIIAAPTCPAVKKGVIDKHLKQLQEKGYRII